jgi:hypothetical protein
VRAAWDALPGMAEFVTDAAALEDEDALSQAESADDAAEQAVPS